MELPPVDMELLARIGAPAKDLPLPILNFGIEPPKSQRKIRPHALSSDECLKLFGVKDAVRMNFIPQMLTAIALEEAEAFMAYCRDNRLEDYKKHNREMRRCINEYNRELRVTYARSWNAYQSYLQRFKDAIYADLFKCWCTFTNEAARQYVRNVHKDILRG